MIPTSELSSPWALIGLNLLALLVAQTLLWLLSLRLRDASIVDIFWGLGFVLVAWLTRLLLDSPSPTSIALPIAATLWGLRLSLYLARRNLGHGEDRRYAAMRDKRPRTFARWSLVWVFWLQGLLGLIVALPLILGQWAHRPAPLPDAPFLSIIEISGLLLFAFGLAYQAIADQQLAAFKRDPRNRGAVMDRGLWRFSRHPNYFGEATLWWGLYLFTLPLPDARLALIGPLLITVLLLKVSGVSLLESTIKERRPAYADYIRRTNAFIPGPPRPR